VGHSLQMRIQLLCLSKSNPLHAILLKKATAGASDWHLWHDLTRARSCLRVDGILRMDPALSLQEANWLMQTTASALGLPQHPVHLPLEGRLCLEGSARLTARCSFVPLLEGRSLVIRFFTATAPDTDRLQALKAPAKVVHRLKTVMGGRDGLVLVAGPTGSGKSTTVRALLQMAVQQHEKVMSIEDPPEEIVPGVQHLSLTDPVALTPAEALRACLRQGPHCIMVGEIRDEESAQLAHQAALSGHRILSTIHARSTRGILLRLADLGCPPEDLIPAIAFILHQRLVCRRNGPGRHLLCVEGSLEPVDATEVALRAELKKQGWEDHLEKKTETSPLHSPLLSGLPSAT
jgi:type II secretory ATPase GspE/PulE/Tfp pilus assembly ATPase PilB-like protein